MKQLTEIIKFDINTNDMVEEIKTISYLRTYLIDVLNVKSIDNELIDFIKHEYKNDIRQTIKTADEVSNNIFLFRSKWDMEKTNIPYHFKGDIDWTFTPNNDPEWCWMLNRHQY